MNDVNESKQRKRAKEGISSGIVGLLINLLLVVIKLFAGFRANSVSILADAMNSLGDSAAAVLTIVGFYIARKPADREHPYGHERAEYISGLFTAIIVLVVGIQFFISSIEKILNPTSVKSSRLVLLLLFVSVVVKGGLGLFYYKKNRQSGMKSNAIEALMKDSVFDVLINLVIIVSYIVEIQFNWYIDGYIGALVALFIIYGGLTSIIESSNDLLGTRPSPDLIKSMQEVLDSYESLVGYHDLILHKYGPNKLFATVDIEVDSRWNLIEAHRVIDSIEKDFKEQFGIVLVCHLDPVVLNDDDHNKVYRLIKRTLKTYSPDYHFHELRIEETGEAKEIFFDVVVPESVDLSNEELYQMITKDLYEQMDVHYPINIEFDRNYVLRE